VNAAGSDASITRQILQAADIVEVVSRYVTLRKAGKDYKALCPFHTEKTPSFYVSPSKQIFKCFGCGVGGDAIKFLQLKENLTFAEARALLAEQVGIKLTPAGRRAEAGGFTRADLARVNAWAMKFFKAQLAGQAGESARRYLRGRGVSDESIRLFNLGYAPDSWDALLRAARRAGISQDLLLAAGLVRAGNERGPYDTFRNRIIFPIIDTLNRVIAFGGRALDDSPAKYLNSPETAIFDKSSALFGLNLAREAMQKAGRAIVVEGYIDCLMAHQHGWPETVAVLGTALSDSHVQLLRRFVERVILVFDGDEAGLRAADRAIEIVLAGQMEVSIAILPAGQDPADLLSSGRKSDFEAALNAATDALEFRWQQFIRRFGADQATGPARRRAVEAFLAFIAQMPALSAGDAVQQGMSLARLAKLLAVPAEQLRTTIRRLRRTRAGANAAGVSTAISGQIATADAEQVALRQVLEVLLNEPAYYDLVRGIWRPDRIEDPDIAEVARQLQQLCEQQRDWELTDLLAMLPDARFGRVVTDLQIAGQRRGRYAETLDGAIKYLQHAEILRCQQETARMLYRGEEKEQEQRLRKLTEQAKNYRFFVPPKWLKT